MPHALESDAPDLVPGWSPEPETLQFLGDLAGVAWFQVNRRREIVAMSRAMESLTGISREKALGRPCIYLSRCHECLQSCRVFDQGYVLGHSLTLYTDQGCTIPVSKTGRVLLDEHGEIAGAVEVVQLQEGEELEDWCSENADGDERQRIRQALMATRYNRTQAAERLGISRTTLWRKMREYDL